MPFKKKQPKSFSYGMDGFIYALKNERHIRWYILYAALFTVSGIFLDFPNWLYFEGFIYFLLLIIFELINTAFEILCDFIVDGHSIQIKRIKDLGAATVFAHGFFAGLLLFVNVIVHVFVS